MCKLIPALLVGFLLLTIGCNKNEVEIPEYEKYDWYAHYIIDGEEQHTIVKDDTDNTEPYLGSFESFGSDLNPDGSIKEVTFVALTTYLQTTSVETDSVMRFSYDIFTPDKDLIAARGKPREERLNALVTYFTDRIYVFDETNLNIEEFLSLRIADKFGNTYINKLPVILLDYSIKVKKVEIVEHKEFGQIVKVLMHINATINDDWYGQDRPLEAHVQTFFLPPFDE